MLVSGELVFVVFILLSVMVGFLYVLVRELGQVKPDYVVIAWGVAWVGWALTVAGVYELKRRGIADLTVIELVIVFFLWHYSSKRKNAPIDPPKPPNKPSKNP